MPKKKTHAEYVAQVEALGKDFTVVGEYVNAHTKITHRCAKGHEWDVQPNSILRGYGCPACRSKTHAEYVAEVKALGKGFEVVGQYQDADTQIAHRCAEGHEWNAAPTNIVNKGRGCPVCYAKEFHVTHESYVAQIKALGNGIEVIGKYKDAKTKITHRCPKGHQWKAWPNYMKRGGGCPLCAKCHTDANVFYIWENADDPGVYKVGITSERCADDRIDICTRKNNMTANIVLVAAVDDARELERRALELGDDPHYPTDIDGYTEFRRYSDAELGAVYQMAVQAA